MINCKESTILTLKKELDHIGMKEAFNLWLHKLFCRFCKEFAKQSTWINQMAHKLEIKAAFSEKEKEVLKSELKTRMNA